MTAVFKKELRASYGNLTAAIASAAMLLIFGLMFRYYNLYNGALTYHYTVSSSVLLFYIAVPVLTMRSFADERKQKTDQLLLTSSQKPAAIVLGKYLALVFQLLLPVLVAALYPLIMLRFQTEQVRETLVWDYAVLLMFFLMGCAYLAIGMFISSCTENIIIAAIGTLVFIFASQMLGSIYTILSMSRMSSLLFLVVLALLAGAVLYLMTKHFPISAGFGAVLALGICSAFYFRPDWFDGRTESVLRVLDFGSHFQNAAGGVFTLSDLLYFISWIVIGNVLTVQSIQRRRWDSMAEGRLQNGSYAAAVTAAAAAAVILVNMIAGALPKGMTSADLSGQKLYSVGSVTKELLDSLETDVTLYLISESGQEDEPVEKLVESYEAYSPRIHYERIDSVAQPTFAKQFTDEPLSLNSVIAVAGDRSEVADYAAFYVYESPYAESPSAFDAEGQITSAIARVTDPDEAKLCYTTGHDEVALSDGMLAALKKSNIETAEVNLLSEEIPEDCTMLMIFAPAADLSDAEAKKVRWYLDNGGHAMIVTMPDQVTGTKTPVLNEVLEAYGLTRSGKLVMEGNENAFVQAPYLIIPEAANTEVTRDLSNRNIVYALPEAIYTADTDDAVYTIESLLLSSASSYLKEGIDTSVAKEEGDEEGSFVLGACVEQSLTEGSMGTPDVPLPDGEESEEEDADEGSDEPLKVMRLLYFTSPCLFSSDALSTLIQQYTALPDGNTVLFANALSYLCDRKQTVSVEAKSLAIPQTVVKSGIQMVLGNALMFLLPGLILVAGIVVWRRRMKR